MLLWQEQNILSGKEDSGMSILGKYFGWKFPEIVKLWNLLTNINYYVL